MRLLRAAVVVTALVSGSLLFAFDTPKTPLPPPTQLFEATDLNGNPVTAAFYLTGGGGLLHVDGQVGSFLVPTGWVGVETNWAGQQIDTGGYYMQQDTTNRACGDYWLKSLPFPANVNELGPCASLSPSLNGDTFNAFNTSAPGIPVFGAVAPLSITTPDGPLVFHDWEVLDPNPGQCRTGNMGVRQIPDDPSFRGLGPAFAEGVEERLSMQNADGSVKGKFRAVYAPASPDVSAPLITVDSPRDCWQIPRHAAAVVQFGCRDLGSGMNTCVSTPGHGNGQAIDTTQYGDFDFTVTATDNSGNVRTRTVRYRVVDATPPTASPVVLTPATAYGWYNHPQIAWNWSDDLEGVGIDPANCTQTSAGIAEGQFAVQTATCRDLAGNVATASITLAVDNTPPGPASDSDDRVLPNPVVQGQSAQGFSPNWTDDLSGVASVDCAPVATDVLGDKTAACTATDRAGNTRTRSISYKVVPPAGEKLFWYEQPVSSTVNSVNVDGTGRSSFVVNAARAIGANTTNFFYVVRTELSDGPLVRTDLDGANAVVVHDGDSGLEVSRSYLYIRNPLNLLKLYPDGTQLPGGWLGTPVGLFTADDQFVYFPAGNQIVQANFDGTGQVAVATIEHGPQDLGQSGNFIYWVDGVDGHIGRVSKDGATLTEHLIDVTAQGIAVGSTYVFWSNAAGGGPTTIGRAKLDGSDVRPSFISGAGSDVGYLTIGGASLPQVNHAPVATGSSATTNEDTQIAGTLAATDVDQDGLTFSVVTPAGNGNVVITNPATGAFTYTPYLNLNGTDTFTFKANDGTVDSNVATVTVTIVPVNDPPAALNATFTTKENIPLLGRVQASDPEGQSLHYRFVGNGSRGIAIMLSPATGTFLYVPILTLNGTDQVKFVANDGALDSAPATVTINITPVNDPPVALPSAVTTHMNQAVTAQLSAIDIDGDTLVFTITKQPAKGSVTTTAAGKFTYTPKANFTGTESFTFKVTDPSGASSTATVTVRVIK